MDEVVSRVTVDVARRLPAADVAALARATAAGGLALRRLRLDAASPALRHAAQQLETLISSNADPAILSGMLLGAADAWRAGSSAAAIDVVWTGPESSVTTGRLTAPVITGLIEEAEDQILLVGYAVQSEPTVAKALQGAASAGVAITLLLERQVDNPRYSGAATVFADLPARRLAWPSENRPASGASLHAKILVVDRVTALVGSANVTAWALERNLERGILIRGGAHPAAICDHIEALRFAGVLTDV